MAAARQALKRSSQALEAAAGTGARAATETEIDPKAQIPIDRTAFSLVSTEGKDARRRAFLR